MDLEKIRQMRAKIEERQSEGGSFSSEHKYVIQSAPATNVMRVVGDPEVCLRSWIKVGEAKPMPFVIDPNGPLFKLIRHVLDYTLKQVDNKWIREYVHAQKHPEIFKMVFGGEGRNSWEPRETYLLNCIPREPQKNEAGQMVLLAKEKKHTLLLAQSNSDVGVGPMAFNEFGKVAENYGDAEGYDVVFSRTGTTWQNTKYSCMQAVRTNPTYGVKVVEGPLTAEELAYERYDLKTLIKPTSSLGIVSALGSTIAQIDATLGTSYLAELQVLAEKEPKEAEKTSEGGTPLGRPLPAQTSSVAAPQTEQPHRRSLAPEADPIVATFPVGATLAPCDKCKKPFPDNWNTCPYCQAKYAVS